MADLVNLAVSQEATNIMNDLLEQGLFKEQVDVLNFAAAYMLKHHSNDFFPETYTPSDSKGSNHHVATLDPSGKLKKLIIAVYPEATEIPYIYLRALMDKGLLQLNMDMANQNFSLLDQIL